jgi:hypothetical protein
MPNKSAKPIQSKSEQAAPQQEEPRLAITLRTMNGFEYHLDLARSVVEGILDPDIDDVYIEVPCSVTGMRRFLHTSNIKEVDVKGL